MKSVALSFLATGGLITSVVTSQAQLTLNFSSIPDSTIQFNGSNSSFQFNPTFSAPVAPANQWEIGSENGGTGSAVGLFGFVYSMASFPSSTFLYGPVTSTIIGGHTVDTASVLGPLGGLNISDGTGNFLTGTFSWGQVETFDYIGGLNAGLTVNVTGLNYTGSNPDLLSLAAQGSASMNLSFQFAPGETLKDLTTGSVPYITSYSGSISAIPEPSSIAIGVTGLIGLMLLKFRRKPAAATK